MIIRFITVTYFILNLSLGLNAQTHDNQIQYSSIGIVNSDYTRYIGAPRQGILKPDSKGKIIIYSEYIDGLSKLENFEYIIVIYHFHEVKSWIISENPPGSKYEFGIFATRSPKRPNPIGFSIVKLEKIENGVLHVSGIDMFDKTPVLDIKPYLPSIDCIKSKINSETEMEYGHHHDNFIYDSIYFR
ncbi:MAG TPA: tRNA (N6-threonylcarbamoyladenosine(37)-N6)-methyltransferase TrmO [Bacteroidales bacterium]|jgi:tRNA (adenine37-N6)-methyltransferase|nr:tRNA (N6-threonylcarbamoyladenosine(37)-N6)-methyltransferase TrmO [Bacteroidales bacterium]